MPVASEVLAKGLLQVTIPDLVCQPETHMLPHRNAFHQMVCLVPLPLAT